jgi:hypothetical protein
MKSYNRLGLLVFLILILASTSEHNNTNGTVFIIMYLLGSVLLLAN